MALGHMTENLIPSGQANIWLNGFSPMQEKLMNIVRTALIFLLTVINTCFFFLSQVEDTALLAYA